MTDAAPTWSPREYAIAFHDTFDLAGEAYRRVCRSAFDAPGFCIIDLGPESSSVAMRQAMVALKRELQSILHARSGRELLYLSAERFDQQQTTKFHLDGAPQESILMLGYEPSDVASEVSLADYSRCAHDLGLMPDDFLAAHNPMFPPGAKLLQPYVTKLDAFSNRSFQIVLINNSHAQYSETNGGWQGVLHTATILNPNESKRRVINSTMIGVFPAGTIEAISEQDQEAFKTTTLVRRKGYDKPHLRDDE